MEKTGQLSLLFSILFWFGAGMSALLAQGISGIVVNINGESLQDVHVRVLETNIQAITAEDGSFRLEMSNLRESASDEITLLVSRIGYQAKKISLEVESFRNEQLTIHLKPEVYGSETVVITATRTLRDMEEVSIPVTVVSGEEIRRSGSMRLSDVLSEQTGMQIVNDHGTGIQVQGFAPDYTKIMIDGNPVIGRTAGTLDLTRISVQNVKQVEIVKGPSSALWGSDALAGVINIITEKETDRVAGGLSSRYGENSTLDLNANLSYNTARWNNMLSVNRNSSEGYQLNPGSVSQTVPDYENYTINYNTELTLGEAIELSTDFRYFIEKQQNRESIAQEGSQILLDGDNTREDFFVRPAMTYSPVNRLTVEAAWMSSFYKTDAVLRYNQNGNLFERTEFNQYYNKPELQAGYRWDNIHHTIAGGGVILEKLDAERYPGQPDFTTQFLFAQHSWAPAESLEFTGGIRYDAHSEYQSQVSPKFSARYKATDKWQFRASVGRGFKAPEFRQLFLDFTNTTAGYSVFGSSTVAEGIRRQMEEGTIRDILIPVESLDEIRAESSWAVNAGFDYDPIHNIRLRVNLFRNNVDDLIETAPVARRTNGQSVYTYFNVDEVISQGVEAEFRWKLAQQLTGSVGYQLLDATRKIERERTVQNEQGEVVQRTDVSFEPMFNRSRHSGNVKLFYESENGWGATVRGTLRGRYGQFDQNGNGFADSNEYEKGYTVWNMSARRSIGERVTLQAGADNLFNYTNINQPYLAGRLWYGQVSLHF